MELFPVLQAISPSSTGNTQNKHWEKQTRKWEF